MPRRFQNPESLIPVDGASDHHTRTAAHHARSYPFEESTDLPNDRRLVTQEGWHPLDSHEVDSYAIDFYQSDRAWEGRNAVRRHHKTKALSRKTLSRKTGGYDQRGVSVPPAPLAVRPVKPLNPMQARMMEAMMTRNLVLALGPAGTGKTYLAISAAVDALNAGRVRRIVLSRPVIEVGASLGFLPGGIEDKMDPWMRPLYDALTDRMGTQTLRHHLHTGTIEIAPIGFMRGRTLNNAFIVIDEAQNCTLNQLRMLLTRLGWYSTMVLTGDPDQSDLSDDISGLREVAERLVSLEDIAVIRFHRDDVVRHPLVAKILGVLG